MTDRNKRFLISLAVGVLAASLTGLAAWHVIQTPHPENGIAARPGRTGTGTHNSAEKAGGGGAAGRPLPAGNLVHLPANRPQIADGNYADHGTTRFSIFHPPPVVSAHLTGIANNPLSFPVRFITSLAGSVGGQTVAIGTEGQGLVMFRPAARPPHRWVEFHPNNKGTGFPSWNVYSVCFDSQGRLWVGTLRKGIVVGKLGRHGWQWRHYDEICRPAGAKHPNLPHQGAMTFNGPLGCHVFAIAEDPLDKSIWISTEAGISVYYPHGAGVSSTAAAATAIMSPVQQYMQGAGQPVRPSAVQPMPPMLFGRWRYITPADGLPASPVDCMAFDSYGNLFVGTQCNGIAAARPQDGYNHWRRIGGHRHVTTHGDTIKSCGRGKKGGVT